MGGYPVHPDHPSTPKLDAPSGLVGYRSGLQAHELPDLQHPPGQSVTPFSPVSHDQDADSIFISVIYAWVYKMVSGLSSKMLYSRLFLAINHLYLSQQFMLNLLADTPRLFGHLQHHFNRSLQPLSPVSRTSPLLMLISCLVQLFL
jgi:hypothetical protein